MNPSLDKALYYLTGNGNIDDVAVEDLERLTTEHPYFSVGHLLLAKKLKLKDDNRFAAQVQKAAVYISNPYWLHYQLLNYPPADLMLYKSADDHRATKQTATTDIHENVSDSSQSTQETTSMEVTHDRARENEHAGAIELNETGVAPTEQPVPITTEFTLNEIEHASELAHESLSEDLTPEMFTPASKAVDAEPEAGPVPITTEFSADEIEHASELAHQSLAPVDPEVEETETVPITTVFTSDELNHASELAHEVLDTPAEDEKRLDDDEAFPWKEDNNVDEQLQNSTGNIVNEPASVEAESTSPAHVENVSQAEENVSQAEEEMAAITREPDAVTERFIEEVTIANPVVENADIQTDTLLEEDEHEKMFQSIKAMLDATTEEAGQPVKGGLIPIDPYHTIDYFASQGIKLDLEQNPQDKLGKQVKKFTHWLKQMKKLGPEDALESVDNAQAEAAVQKIADTSNTAREVVTEAMAQVLEKQGKNEKAVQLYIKLSFLNPDKSAYFADKIKKLKGI
jgi:hypothetical protein